MRIWVRFAFIYIYEKKTAIMLFACFGLVCWVKNCDQGLENATCSLRQHFQDLSHSFLLHGLILSQQITFIFSFFHFHFYPHKHAVICKCSKLTIIVKRNFFIFNIVIKICFEKKAFVFQLSCVVKSWFQKKLLFWKKLFH